MEEKEIVVVSFVNRHAANAIAARKTFNSIVYYHDAVKRPPEIPDNTRSVSDRGIYSQMGVNEAISRHEQILIPPPDGEKQSRFECDVW